ncbi:MAG: inositol monophosphatase family protein, partial [Candidatus Dormiibacterota bacterium]
MVGVPGWEGGDGVRRQDGMTAIPGGSESADTPDDALAGWLADHAGRALMALRERAAGLTPGELRDQGDRLSHLLLTEALARLRPGDAVLSEEGADDRSRLSSPRVWVIDPLDGTREFGEEGRTDWAVHVALVEVGIPVAAAVSLPARGLVVT